MRKIMKLVKRLIFAILLIVLGIVGYVCYDGYNLYKESIAKVSIEKKVDRIMSDPSYLTYDEIPSLFVNAIVAVEDHRFYEHSGIDIFSLTRAAYINIKERSLVQGGSTITQQLAKNMYFSFEKKFTRKIAELLVAIDLEKKYSKKQIVCLYINTVYFGDGYYGLKEAANGYFNKQPHELSDDQITLLAGIPNAPSLYALSSNEKLARKRQEVVIDCLKRYGNINE